MSFLQYIDMDPHIHLFALQKQPRQQPQTQSQVKQKLHHLLKTRRFDQILSYASLLEDLVFPDLKARIQDARKKTEDEKKQLGCEELDATLNKLEVMANKEDPDDEYIDSQHFKIYRLGKIFFDQGKYDKAYDIIKKLQKQLLNQVLFIKTTWARFYCQILLQAPKVRKTAQKLKTKLDKYEQKQKLDRKAQPYQKLNQAVKQSFARRRQFLNLITITYFLEFKDQNFENYVNYCTDEENSSVMQTLCPYLVRYLCVALILNKTLHKNRKFDLFALIEAIRRKVYKYTDAFVEFLAALHIQFDFQQAKNKISQIKKVIKQDFLLRPLQSKILQNCNFLFYKTYCKVHQRIPLSQIAQFTGKSEQQAELWILRFIRSLDIEAKIDSVERVVLSNREEQNLNEVYVDLIPKMNGIVQILGNTSNIEN